MATTLLPSKAVPTEREQSPRVHGLPAAACATIGGDTRAWATLAVGSLLLAGLLSLFVVIGRLPPFNSLIADPMFFKRCLVVHVDLALLVWFYAFVAALVAATGTGAATRTGRIAAPGAAIGILLMLAGALAPGADPVLANYVPVIDHPLFLGGLALFFLSVSGYLLAGLFRARKSAEGLVPEESATGLQAASVAVVLALTTWIAAKTGLPAGLDRHSHFELSMWGAGHALQVANACAMVGVWLWLVRHATGVAMVTSRTARRLFILLLIPHLCLPLLSVFGTNQAFYLNGATLLMRWGIFPVVLIVLGGAVWHIRRRGVEDGPVARAALAGFLSSAGLTLLGFILGAMIRGSSTLIPAHYHASLGGVTASFMAGAYLITASQTAFNRWGSARRQLLLFGIGQAIFALGFGIGGLYGLGRKAYAGSR